MGFKKRPTYTKLKNALDDLELFAQASDEYVRESLSVEFNIDAAVDFVQLEARLGIRLPEAYKQFISEFGTFTIGPQDDVEPFGIFGTDSIDTLSKHLNVDYGVSTTTELAAQFGRDVADVNLAQHGIVFGVLGPNNNYYLFDARTADPVTGECKIFYKDEEDENIGTLFEDRYCKGSNFESFMIDWIAQRKRDSE